MQRLYNVFAQGYTRHEEFKVKRLLTLVALTLSALTAFGEEPDLVEGAKRAIVYWHSLFLQCGSNQGQRGGWYAVSPNAGGLWIQMVPELRIQFKTEELSQEERLNGFEFKATTSLEPSPFRWWIAPNKTWRDWQIGEVAPPLILIKRKGIWSAEFPPNRNEDRKPLASCSEVPSMEDRR
jgi:hypothetical protein